ncbi:helix-turn-helix domain-containing protein [Tistrella mobilis]
METVADPAVGRLPSTGAGWALTLEGGVSVAAGTLAPTATAAPVDEELLFAGLKVVLIESGALACGLAGQPDCLIRGPAICAITAGPVDGMQTPQRGWQKVVSPAPLVYSMICIADTTPADAPRLLHAPAPAVLRQLAAQIRRCPLQGTARRLYLAGKALELAGLTLDTLTPQSGLPTDAARAGTGRPLSPAETDRVHAACAILASSLANPPEPAVLARAVGLPVRRLVRGVHDLHGRSVHALLQELRLCEAHRLLRSEGLDVVNAAWRVGYSPAHFTTLFRRRFGITPGRLRQR